MEPGDEGEGIFREQSGVWRCELCHLVLLSAYNYDNYSTDFSCEAPA